MTYHNQTKELTTWFLTRVATMGTHARYFLKGNDWSLGTETFLMPWVNKAVVFEDLFLVGLRMPSHLVLVEILQKFRVQLHQLTPNDIV
jgi:hypothetical protein